MDSVVWKLHREIVLLAGWGRAILLQLAHPLVARGVADHSGFTVGRWGRLERLDRTLSAMLTLTFGAPHEAEAIARIVNGIHDRVHGELAAPEGVFPAGTRYSAHDPALLAWVHATLLDSLLVTYELFVGPLTAAERDRYCEESCGVERLLGMPGGSLPRSAPELVSYLDARFASGDIVVTDTARRLASEILHPPDFLVARPFLALARLPAVGLLPPEIREGYGLSWSRRQERALLAVAMTSRHLLPLLPGLLRYWPAARAAGPGRRAPAQRSVGGVAGRSRRL